MSETINCPQGFFLNEIATPAVIEDLASAIQTAQDALNGLTASSAAAAASAADAASSDTDAQNQAAAAATSASAAATSATGAASSATAASTSNTNATTQANNASTSATAASGSASAAAASATSASGSATAAANSASSAATSAANAAASATTVTNAVGTIPTPGVGNKLAMIRVNASGNAYEAQTPAQVATNIGALNDVGRNKIHNAQFNIAQRGAGPFTTSGYTLDRWLLSLTTDTASVLPSAVLDTARSQIGDEEAARTLGITFTGTSGATALTVLAQRIESVRRLSGKTVTISFFANASATLSVGINLTQNFGTGGSPSAAAAVLATGNAITLNGTTWARHSTTIAIPSTSGKTLGSNGDDFTALQFFFSSGSTTNATAGNIGVQSGTINLWGVQLEVGSITTPLEKSDPQTDLANCQRFFTIGRIVTAGMGSSTAAVIALISLPTQMRASPIAGAVTTTATNTGTVSVTAPAPGGVSATFTPPATSGYIYDANFTATADL